MRKMVMMEMAKVALMSATGLPARAKIAAGHADARPRADIMRSTFR